MSKPFAVVNAAVSTRSPVGPMPRPTPDPFCLSEWSDPKSDRGDSLTRGRKYRVVDGEANHAKWKGKGREMKGKAYVAWVYRRREAKWLYRTIGTGPGKTSKKTETLGANASFLTQDIVNTLQGHGQCTWEKPIWYISSTFKMFPTSFLAVFLAQEMPRTFTMSLIM